KAGVDEQSRSPVEADLDHPRQQPADVAADPPDRVRALEGAGVDEDPPVGGHSRPAPSGVPGATRGPREIRGSRGVGKPGICLLESDKMRTRPRVATISCGKLPHNRCRAKPGPGPSSTWTWT